MKDWKRNWTIMGYIGATMRILTRLIAKLVYGGTGAKINVAVTVGLGSNISFGPRSLLTNSMNLLPTLGDPSIFWFFSLAVLIAVLVPQHFLHKKLATPICTLRAPELPPDQGSSVSGSCFLHGSSAVCSAQTNRVLSPHSWTLRGVLILHCSS